MKLSKLEIFWYLAFAIVVCAALYFFFGRDLVKIHSAKNAISATMFDPDSAKFRNMHIGPSGKVCGEVNGKNRYGAYVGFRYVVYRDTANDDRKILIEDIDLCNSGI